MRWTSRFGMSLKIYMQVREQQHRSKRREQQGASGFASGCALLGQWHLTLHLCSRLRSKEDVLSNCPFCQCPSPSLDSSLFSGDISRRIIPERDPAKIGQMLPNFAKFRPNVGQLFANFRQMLYYYYLVIYIWMFRYVDMLFFV